MSIKVCHIIDTFGNGGIEAGLKTIVTNSSSDLEHSIISFRSSNVRTPVADHYCLDISGGCRTAFLPLLKAVNKIQPDIVHFRNYGVFLDSMICANAFCRARWVFGYHGQNMHEIIRQNYFRDRIFRVLSRKLDAITTLNESMAKEISIRLGIKVDGIRILPNGTSTNRKIDSSARLSLGSALRLNPCTLILGTISRLDKVKNVELLIDSFKDLVGRFDVALVVIGDGPERESLQARAAGLDKIFFLGHRDDARRLLEGFDIYVQASWYEGFSNTILEAMAVGLPVLVSKVGGNPGLVTDTKTGLLFDPRSKTQFINKLAHLIFDNGLRDKMKENARIFVAEKFSIQKMISNYNSFYATLGKAEF